MDQTITLYDNDSNVEKELTRYVEYIPEFVFWDGMAYKFSYQYKDNLVYTPCGNAMSLK